MGANPFVEGQWIAVRDVPHSAPIVVTSEKVATGDGLMTTFTLQTKSYPIKHGSITILAGGVSQGTDRPGMPAAHYTGPTAIYGDDPWEAEMTKAPAEFSTSGAFLSNLKDADPAKGKAFIDSIMSGRYLNEAAAGIEATFTTILGRMAAFTGREVSWDEMLRSDQVLDPQIDMSPFA
jgi:hypothetical protein